MGNKFVELSVPIICINWPCSPGSPFGPGLPAGPCCPLSPGIPGSPFAPFNVPTYCQAPLTKLYILPFELFSAWSPLLIPCVCEGAPVCTYQTLPRVPAGPTGPISPCGPGIIEGALSNPQLNHSPLYSLSSLVHIYKL